MDIERLPVEPSLLGESPLWHPQEKVLYWCDIPGRALHRYDPDNQTHASWDFAHDLGCCAACDDGTLIVAQRDGLLRLDPTTGRQTAIANAPYDIAVERFNDGKTDPQGRFWVGTIYEPRDAPQASLYRLNAQGLQRVAGHITTSNGLAWSPDGRTMYWADTKDHTIAAWDYDPERGEPSNRRIFARFDPPEAHRPSGYDGRPDGAAVDSEGCYWVAMFEGGRVLRYSPQGELLRTIHLPVRCPTMPCFGGADLRTLYITTARETRPPDEPAAMPWSGCVLQMRIDVPGLPTQFVRQGLQSMRASPSA
ncbi:MAG: SMP-30/gluconolactonase/LRE family protein [Variovorax sp.]|nr:SMP-30/gluconolactonase/LRE family protein [Variovorax sp.]